MKIIIMSSDELLNKMKEDSKSEHVAFTNFSIAYSNKNKDLLYCFFEGYEDKRYYGARIKLKTDRDFRDFNCGGIGNVEKLVKLIKNKSEYDSALTLFFTDKDYSNNKVDKDTYVTPCYSIENFYTSKQAVSEILINEFNLNTDEKDYRTATELYINLQDKFHKNLLFLNSWLACQNDIREKESKKTYLTIDKVTKEYFKKFLKDDLITIDDFNDFNNHEYLENTLFPSAPKIGEDILTEKIAFFNSSNKECIFRGKFEMKFMITFLQKLKNEICKKDSTIFDKKCKCSLIFDVNYAISGLSQYADTPECLLKYLKEYKKAV